MRRATKKDPPAAVAAAARAVEGAAFGDDFKSKDAKTQLKILKDMGREKRESLVAVRYGTRVAHQMLDQENELYHSGRVECRLHSWRFGGATPVPPVPKFKGFRFVLSSDAAAAADTDAGADAMEPPTNACETYLDEPTSKELYDRGGAELQHLIRTVPLVGPGTSPLKLWGEGGEALRSAKSSSARARASERASTRVTLCTNCKQPNHKTAACTNPKVCGRCLHDEHEGECEVCAEEDIVPPRACCAERCPIPGCYHLGKRAQHAKNGCKQCPPGEGCNGLADRRRAAAQSASSVGTDGAVDGDDDAAAASDGLGVGPAAGASGGEGAHGTDEFEEEGDPDVIQIDDHDECEIMSAVLTAVMDAVDESTMDRFIDMVGEANGSPDDEEAAVSVELGYIEEEIEEGEENKTELMDEGES